MYSNSPFSVPPQGGVDTTDSPPDRGSQMQDWSKAGPQQMDPQLAQLLQSLLGQQQQMQQLQAAPPKQQDGGGLDIAKLLPLAAMFL